MIFPDSLLCAAIVSVESVPNRRMPYTVKCKILLPKFNTWEQVHLERENGCEVPLCSIVGRFSAKNFCRYGVIALPFHCNGSAISL